MKVEQLHLGQQVKHPQYGLGMVKAINEHAAEIRFSEGVRTIAPETSGLQPVEAQAALSGLELPLQELLDRAARALVRELGLERPESVIEELGARWHRGRMVLHPAGPGLTAKEVPLEQFFHKIVMMRNNLRLLEQKINGHPQLTDGDKVEMQQYVTRCYGSMTTFNLLFKEKEGQFSTGET